MFPWGQNLPRLRKTGLNVYEMTYIFLFSNMDIHIQLTSHKLRTARFIARSRQPQWILFCDSIPGKTGVSIYHQSLTWQVSFIGITFRNRNDSKTDISPKFAPAWVMTHEIWKWGTHCTTFRHTFSRYFSWSETLLGNLVDLRYLSIILIDYIH